VKRETASGHRAPLWKKLLLLAVSTLLGLVLAEVTLRVFFWSKGIGRADVREILQRSKTAELPVLDGGAGLFGLVQPSSYPEIVYELKPHLKGMFQDAVIATNRFGLRGPEISQEKPQRTFRIVGLGDSHMFGWGVGQEELYLALLQRQLNENAESGWRFEVLNFGTPGYNTVMEVATFEHRALAFDPDLVVLHFVGNDLFAPHFLLPPRDLDPSHWFLIELLRGLFGPGEQQDELVDFEAHTGPEAEGSARERRLKYDEMKGRGPFRRALQHLAELSRPRRIPVLFFELGEGSRLRRMARDAAREVGFRFFNPALTFSAMLAEMKEAPEKENFERLFVLGTHPSVLGHQAYARALFCELQRMRIPHLNANPEACISLAESATQRTSDQGPVRE